MPIANIPVSRVQFEALQQNITDVFNTIASAGTIAQSGLQYVVDLQVAAPEVDLIGAFNSQLQRIDGLDSASNFTGIVAALNLHALTRGASGIGSLSDRLNEYLTNYNVLVSAEYASLSQQAGFIIDTGHIDPTIVITTSTLPGGTHNVSYSQTISTTGGTAPLYFSEVGVLPLGLALNQSSGLVSGTPTTAGSYTFTVTVTDAIGSATSHDYTIVIA